MPSSCPNRLAISILKENIKRTAKSRRAFTQAAMISRLADFGMAEIKQALAVDSKIASSTFWMDLVSSQYDGNRHRALISVTFGVFAQWSGVGVVS